MIRARSRSCGKRVVREGVVESHPGLLLDRLGQALGLLGQVDVGAEVSGGPFGVPG